MDIIHLKYYIYSPIIFIIRLTGDRLDEFTEFYKTGDGYKEFFSGSGSVYAAACGGTDCRYT